jgi:hypothetical protein
LNAPTTVFLQMKVPLPVLERLKKTRVELAAAHEKELEIVRRKALSTASEGAMQRHRELKKRGKKITLHNVARVALAQGMSIFDDIAESLTKIEDEGMARGRPRGK